MEDKQLLREYLEGGSEAAFAALVERHLNLVYSAAFRRLGDSHAAEDVSQSVFCLLAVKARQFDRDVSLVSWLHQTASFKASKYWRTETRRRKREKEAVMISSTDSEDTEVQWQRLAPHLDDALGHLTESDRRAILGRFFQQQPLRDLGEALGIGEDAARMRVNRALEKLRQFLVRKGATCSLTLLGALLAAKAVQAAPAPVLTSVQTAAVAAAKAASAPSLLAVIAAFLVKAKIQIAATTVTALVVTAVVLAVRLARTSHNGAPVLTPATTAPPRLANNHFANRAILGTPGRISRTNNRADTEGDERIQSGLTRWGATLWWKWTAPASGPVMIDTVGSGYDTHMAVYTGTSLRSLTLVTENDNASEVGVGESLVRFDAKAGTEYEIQVGGVYTGGGGGAPVRGLLQLNLETQPLCHILTPKSGAKFLGQSNVTVSVSASSAGGAVTNVSLYRGSLLVGTRYQAPYDFSVSNPLPGSNFFYSIATDSRGQVSTSEVVSVLVANRGITLLSPCPDAVFQETKRIKLSAFGLIETRPLTNVAFFIDDQQIGEGKGDPPSATWRTVTAGAHRISAFALDDRGNSYQAPPIGIAVAHTLFSTGSVWRYLDDGSDQGTRWTLPGFEDSAWKSGRGEFGYGDGDEATRVEDNPMPGFESTDTQHFITTYFRKSFVLTNASNFEHLVMNVKRDDGAVVYLNGREAARFNMNTGAVNCLTLARNAGDDGKVLIPATVSANFLSEGTNVVAVEIHQATADSTDISFDMDLRAIPALPKEWSTESVPGATTATSPTARATFLNPGKARTAL